MYVALKNAVYRRADNVLIDVAEDFRDLGLVASRFEVRIHACV